jgi:hypothetical protein
MTEGATSTIASDYALVSPADGLLMDEIDSCEWSWLTNELVLIARYMRA